MAEALDALLDRYWYDQSGLTRSKVLIESQFNAELAKAEITVGKRLPNAHEFLGAKRLGKCVIRLVYLQHFENFCSGWALTFYKARHEFKLISLNFGDSVEDDLKTFTTTEPTP